MPYINHPQLKTPTSEQMLWRYLDFPKFAALIQNRILFFPSIIQLQNDPWEGCPSPLNFHPDQLISISEVIEEAGYPKSKIRIEKQGDFFGPDRFEDHVKTRKQSYQKLRKAFFVNCWHMNDSESDSQWKVYGDSSCSLAIVTTHNNLCDSIIDSRNIYGSEIIYYDHNQSATPESNAFFSVIYKRQAFSHEREFRLIFVDFEHMNSTDFENLPGGVSITIDLEKLIKNIIISPQAPDWFLNVIENFLKSNNLSIPFAKSNLLKPFDW